MQKEAEHLLQKAEAEFSPVSGDKTWWIRRLNIFGRHLTPSLYYKVKPDVILKDVCKNDEISPSVLLDATTLPQTAKFLQKKVN